MKRDIQILITVVAELLAPTVLLARSGIVLVKNGKILLGNNDTSYANQLALRVARSQDDLFGRVCVSMDVVPGWTPVGLDCMNERGLALVDANVPAAPPRYDPDKPQFMTNHLRPKPEGAGGPKSGCARGSLMLPNLEATPGGSSEPCYSL